VAQFSKMAGALAGVGLALLYALGTTTYAMGELVFGVAPFQFTLGACLEAGVRFITQIVYTLPILLLAGAQKTVYRSIGSLFIFLLPFLGFAIVVFSTRKRLKRLKLVSSVLVLAYLLVIFLIFFATNIYYCTYQDLLLNPAINLALAAGPSVDFGSLGLSDPAGFLRAAMFKDPDEPYQLIFSISILLSLNLFLPLMALGFARLVGAASARESGRLAAMAKKGRRIVQVVAGVFLVFSIFWLASYMSLASATHVPKVDASIKGFEALTSQAYLILYADYGDRYAFYAPTEQRVILVAKTNVDHVELRRIVSMFDNRAVFRKGPYLGIGYQARTAKGSDGSITVVGLEINEVEVGSPAYKAGLAVGDVILSLGGRGPLDLARDLAGILKAAPRDQPLEVVFRRKEKTVEGKLTLEDRP